MNYKSRNCKAALTLFGWRFWDTTAAQTESVHRLQIQCISILTSVTLLLDKGFTFSLTFRACYHLQSIFTGPLCQGIHLSQSAPLSRSQCGNRTCIRWAHPLAPPKAPSCEIYVISRTGDGHRRKSGWGTQHLQVQMETWCPRLVRQWHPLRRGADRWASGGHWIGKEEQEKKLKAIGRLREKDDSEFLHQHYFIYLVSVEQIPIRVLYKQFNVQGLTDFLRHTNK